VVSIRLADLNRQTTGGGCGVDEKQCTLVSAADAGRCHGHACGGLVLGSGVRIDACFGSKRRRITGITRVDRRNTEVGSGTDALGELATELAEGQELGAVVDQAKCSNVPEGSCAAVAEDHLVTVRK
jgi:hypothetical protein